MLALFKMVDCLDDGCHTIDNLQEIDIMVLEQEIISTDSLWWLNFERKMRCQDLILLSALVNSIM